MKILPSQNSDRTSKVLYTEISDHKLVLYFSRDRHGPRLQTTLDRADALRQEMLRKGFVLLPLPAI
jgi:hypothetical protein